MTTARVHCQVKSGPVSRSNRAPVRLCAPYLLARPRTTSTDAHRNPSMLVPSQQKDQKNQKKIQKNERKSFWTLAVTSQCRIKTKRIVVTEILFFSSCRFVVRKFVPVRSLEENSEENYRHIRANRERPSGRSRARIRPRVLTASTQTKPEGKHHSTTPRARTSSSGDHIH